MGRSASWLAWRGWQVGDGGRPREGDDSAEAASDYGVGEAIGGCED